MSCKLRWCLLSVLFITLCKPGHSQTGSGDSIYIQCEEKIKEAMRNWNHAIVNNNETPPVSFVRLFKVDNEATKKLALAKLTADTTYVAYLGWHNNRGKVIFIRQGKCWNKKVTMLRNGVVTTGRFWTK